MNTSETGSRVKRHFFGHFRVQLPGRIAVGGWQLHVENHVEITRLLSWQTFTLQAQFASLTGASRNRQLHIPGGHRHRKGRAKRCFPWRDRETEIDIRPVYAIQLVLAKFDLQEQITGFACPDTWAALSG
jgi:hypothetical protein